MFKLSYKTLLIILISLLISIVVLLKFVLPKQKVSAAWWNDGWNYRKAISINNTSGSNLTDFQMSLSIGTSALIASSKMQSDCDDIRVTDINGNLLPYWIETNGLNACNQSNTVIWVKISSISTSDSTIYIYYGNASASSVSNGNNVFVFFDDFNNPTIDTNKWNLSGSMFSISGNRLRGDRINGTGSLFSKNTFPRPFVLDYDFYPTQYPSGWEGSYHGTMSFGTYNTSYQTEHAWIPHGGGGNSYCGLCDDGGCYHGSYVNPVIVGNTLYKESMQIKSLQAGPQGFMTYSNRRDDNTGSQASGTVNTGATTGNDPLYIGFNDYGGNTTDDFEWDNWRVRKYASIEPTTTLQSEEVGGGPIAYWKFDEGVGTTALNSISNLNTGTITGATWQTEDQCISGKCLNFNGSGSPNVNIPNNNTLNFGTNNFTISAWALHRDYTYPKSNFMIKKSNSCFNDGASNSGFDIGHGYKSTGIDICLHDTSNNVVHQTLVFNNGFQPSQLINKWTHYEFIFNRTSGKIIAYINGIKQTNEINISSVTDSINNNYSLTIGTMYGWQTDGLYDDIKIYPYARSADQIKLDYNSRGSLNGSSVNLGVQSSTVPSLNSKLVAYYKFDEGSGTTAYDSTTNQNNGTFGTGTSAPIWTNNGKFNKALSFNGSSHYLSTPYIPNISSNQITVSAWINPNSVSGTQEISNQGQWDGGPWTGWRFQLTSGSISFKLGDGISTPYTYSAGTININTWQQVVGVWDGSYIHIYINGKEVGKSAKSFTYSGNNNTHWIGKYPGTGYFFNGLIDEVKIYNTALTEDEIKQDYNQGSAISFGATNQTIGGTTTSLDYCIPGDTSYCASPVGEWKMDEKTGTSINDSSGNNNTGTFGTGNSAPTWTSGKIGAGLNFNGSSQYVDFNPDILDSSCTGTVSLWIKRGPWNESYNTIVTKSNGASWNNKHIQISRDSTTNNINMTISDNSSSTTNNVTTGTINENTWYYLTMVWNGSVLIGYINGQEVDRYNTSICVANDSTRFSIGRGAVGTNRFFNGKIDHVKIYNYARTPAQIAYDYNKGAPVGWWKLDDCQGLTAFDSSGLGNTGAISIGPSGTQTSAGTCNTSGTAWSNGVNGKYNSSLNFDGNDDYVSIPNNSIFNLANTNHSFSLWFKAPSTMTDNPSMIFQRYTGGAPGAGYWIAINSNKVYYENRADGGDNLSITSNASYNDSIWHQVIITVDISSKIAKMYIDGKYIKSDSYTGNLLDNNANITFGGQGTSYSFQGQADDVRIYNYALTSEQIKTVYNNGAVNFQ